MYKFKLLSQVIRTWHWSLSTYRARRCISLRSNDTHSSVDIWKNINIVSSDGYRIKIHGNKIIYLHVYSCKAAAQRSTTKFSRHDHKKNDGLLASMAISQFSKYFKMITKIAKTCKNLEILKKKRSSNVYFWNLFIYMQSICRLLCYNFKFQKKILCKCLCIKSRALQL